MPADSGLLANDGDFDGDSLTAVLITRPSHGTLQINSDGSFTYTPDANYSGDDSFTYRNSDGSLESEPATVTITVNQATLIADIDIQPKDSRNTIRLSRSLEVAIFSRDGFDATRIDVDSLRFGKTGTEESLRRDRRGRPIYRLVDVNGDGLLDLIAVFEATREADSSRAACKDRSLRTSRLARVRSPAALIRFRARICRNHAACAAERLQPLMGP